MSEHPPLALDPRLAAILSMETLRPSPANAAVLIAKWNDAGTDATKLDIKEAFEERFEAKVEKINIKIMRDGKHAIIKLKPEYSAEEIGMRIGIF